MTLTRALQARRLFAPIYAVFNDLRRGEVTLHGAVPVFQDWSGEWFELRAAIEGWCDCWTRIQAERDIGFDPRPLRQLAARLHYGTPVSPAEIAAARHVIDTCRRAYLRLPLSLIKRHAQAEETRIHFERMGIVT